MGAKQFLWATAVLAWAQIAGAQTTNLWTLGGPGKWEDGVNWSAGAPTNSNAANLITNATTKTVTVDLISVSSNALNDCMTISNLVISGAAGTINTLQLTNAGVVTPLRIFNSATVNSGGALLVTNSNLLINGPTAGAFFVDGTVDLRATGSILLTNGAATFPGMIIGNVATGVVTMTGGFIRPNGSIKLGNAAGARGTLTMSGGSILLSASDLVVGDAVSSTGSVAIIGGSVTGGSSHGITVGNNGSGELVVSNATVDIWNLAVGVGFNCRGGTLTVGTGGTFICEDPFEVGFFSGSTGTVWLTGGTLQTVVQLSGTARQSIGDGGVGTMIMSNGTFIARGNVLDVGFSDRGTLTIFGGTNTVTGFLVLGEAQTGFGTVNVNGGRLIVTNAFKTTTLGDTGKGAVTVSGGTMLVRDLQVGRLLTSKGTLTVQSSGTLAILSERWQSDSTPARPALCG